MKMKICEVFTSFQGEGYWMGKPAAFIRFAGCNIHCPFCDEHTKYKNILDWDEEQIAQAVEEYEHVIFTGGEPMLQVDAWHDFAKDLHKDGHYLHIETNGTLSGVPKFIDWVTCSPKESGMWKIRVNPNEIKLVIDKKLDTATIRDIANTHKKVEVWLQPCDGPDLDWSMNRIQHLLRELPNCRNLRAGIQMHKYYNAR